MTNDDPRTTDFPDHSEGRPAPVVRDRRRIDPETGAVREPDAAQAPAAGTPQAEPEPGTPQAQAQLLTQALAERTADLQRLQAEYVNYKRRVDRDREVNREIAVASVLSELLHTLDDIGRAREAGELEGAFKAVAESVERVADKAGLVKYGEVGDGFDPRIHEALLHNYSDDVGGPTATMVMQPGYRLGDRILRPARVAVSEPTEQLPDAAPQAEAAGTEGGPGAEDVAGGNDVSDSQDEQAAE